MMITLKDKMRGLSQVRRKKIAARTAELIVEERSLQDLRQARKLAQRRLGRALHIGKDEMTQLEERSDLLLSSLRSQVEAKGGRLSLVAEFPDREPVKLSGMADIGDHP
jgi:hypothetical protein